MAMIDKKNAENKELCEACGKMVCECSTMYEEKWIQAANATKGALHKELGIPEGKPIPMSLLTKKKAELSKKAEGDKKLSPSDSKLLHRINFAINTKKLHEEMKAFDEEVMNEEGDKEETLMEKSPPGYEKQVEETKKALIKKGYDEEKAANIAFGKAWNEYNKLKEGKENIGNTSFVNKGNFSDYNPRKESKKSKEKKSKKMLSIKGLWPNYFPRASMVTGNTSESDNTSDGGEVGTDAGDVG